MKKIETIRTFIAINIEEEIKEILSKEIEKLINPKDKIKWVLKQSLHLTLKFLGNITSSKIEEVYQKIKPIVQKESPFRISLKSLGIFPNFKKPQIVWIKVNEGREKIIELAKEIDVSLEEIGFLKEKREYIPHLTIGRIKKLNNKEEFLKRIDKLDIQEYTTIAKSVDIMKSNLTPKGAIYTPIKEIIFKSTDIS
jgi:2'-5' RNA ligase